MTMELRNFAAWLKQGQSTFKGLMEVCSCSLRYKQEDLKEEKRIYTWRQADMYLGMIVAQHDGYHVTF